MCNRLLVLFPTSLKAQNLTNKYLHRNKRERELTLKKKKQNTSVEDFLKDIPLPKKA